MNIIPVVFCFDDNWEIPACVCITSLLENANADTFYDIFILYSAKSTFLYNGRFEEIAKHYPQCKINFRSVGDAFENAFEIRGVTNSTYFRLLIPELIPEYDKIMYHDVDVIFRTDLSAIFDATDVNDCYVAGVNSPGGLFEHVRVKREKLGLDWREYILAGNIIFNSKKLRDDGIVERFKQEVATKQYEFQDMDIINIICKGKIKRMPPEFCGTIEIFRLAANKIEQALYSQLELKVLENQGIIHYNGSKPWKQYCPNFDIWWEYYRKSIVYDPLYYFTFFENKLTEYDDFSLLKRLKLVLRYFKK